MIYRYTNTKMDITTMKHFDCLNLNARQDAAQTKPLSAMIFHKMRTIGSKNHTPKLIYNKYHCAVHTFIQIQYSYILVNIYADNIRLMKNNFFLQIQCEIYDLHTYLCAWYIHIYTYSLTFEIFSRNNRYTMILLDKTLVYNSSQALISKTTANFKISCLVLVFAAIDETSEKIKRSHCIMN